MRVILALKDVSAEIMLCVCVCVCVCVGDLYLLV